MKNKTNGWKNVSTIIVEKRAKQCKFFFIRLIINSIGEFKYSPEEKVTFVACFHCYEEVFQKDCTTWSDEKNTTVARERWQN